MQDANVCCGFGGSFSIEHPAVADHVVARKLAAAGATVMMPVQDMFWGDRYGKLIDPFGHVWAIATHVKDMTPAQMKKAAMSAMPPPPPPPPAA
jgi:uncharacterized glyoxalase superfamily protein PhnB